MEKRNMAGVTEREALERMDKHGRCLAAAAVCGLAVATAAVGRLVWAACMRWPVLDGVFQGFGVALALALTVALVYRRG